MYWKEKKNKVIKGKKEETRLFEKKEKTRK